MCFLGTCCGYRLLMKPLTFLDFRGIVVTSCICHAYSCCCSIDLGNVTSSHRVISLPSHSCLALPLHRQCPWILPLLCSLPEKSLQFHEQQRLRQKPASCATQNIEPITFKTRLERKYSQPAPASTRSLTRTSSLLDVNASDVEPIPFRVPAFCRASSPLSPQRRLLPGRPIFPKSTPDPDLYRLVLKKCLRHSSRGQRFLQMRPRPAPAVLAATQVSNRAVADEDNPMQEDYFMDYEDDFSMNLQYEDWEMLDGEDVYS